MDDEPLPSRILHFTDPLCDKRVRPPLTCYRGTGAGPVLDLSSAWWRTSWYLPCPWSPYTRFNRSSGDMPWVCYITLSWHPRVAPPPSPSPPWGDWGGRGVSWWRQWLRSRLVSVAPHHSVCCSSQTLSLLPCSRGGRWDPRPPADQSCARAPSFLGTPTPTTPPPLLPPWREPIWDPNMHPSGDQIREVCL